MKKINLVFPMAGQGERFGGIFKPFIKIGNKTFIELALEPFFKWSSHINKVYFIVTQEQNEKYQVNENLIHWIKPGFFNIEIIELEEQTVSVCQTIAEFCILEKHAQDNYDFLYSYDFPTLFCDCDHSVNIDPLMEKILERHSQFTYIIPTWDIDPEKYSTWGLAKIGADNCVLDTSEKDFNSLIGSAPGEIKGIIGCYYFESVNFEEFDMFNYISEILHYYLDDEEKTHKVLSVPIKEAIFFGDPQSYEKVLNQEFRGTVFCDIDGTIIKHETDHFARIIPLSGSIEKLSAWQRDGYYIVLTTARDRQCRDILEKQLNEHGLVYHELLMNLPSGPRYLINDRKPQEPLKAMAKAYEPDRDEGIKTIDLDNKKVHFLNTLANEKIIKQIKSGSGAVTDLVQKGNEYFVRKTAYIQDQNSVINLREQAKKLQWINKRFPGLSPEYYRDWPDLPDHYVYEMQYMNGYKQLSEYSDKKRIKGLNTLLLILSKLYTYQGPVSEEWLRDHFVEKIYHHLRNHNIGNCKHFDYFFNKIFKDNYDLVKPDCATQVHGDLTYENILYNHKTGDIRLIDFYGPAGGMSIPEMDLGKLFQSIITRYEWWSRVDAPELPGDIKFKNNYDNDKKLILSNWQDIFGGDLHTIAIKGMVYMLLHLIRMLPYREKKSTAQLEYTKHLIERYTKITYSLIKHGEYE